MKWIGQHIYDLIARFRDDVYLEDISDGTVVDSKFLGLDSNGKVIKEAVSVSVTDLHSAGVDGSANQLLTDNGDGTVTSEPYLKWDGNNFNIQSVTSTKPLIAINSLHSDAEASELQFSKGTTGTDGDDLGKISFHGYDSGGNEQNFAQILGEIVVAADGDEEGKLTLSIASHDGEVQPGLIIASGNAEDEVDVTVGNGATSLTTVAGKLTMGSTATLNNTGEIVVASQPNITTLTGLTSLGSAGATTDIAAGDVTMYNAVNDGNPTISLGSDATNRFEIKSTYNSGHVTLDQVEFNSYTTSSTTNDGRYVWTVDETELARLLDAGLTVYGNTSSVGSDVRFRVNDQSASDATSGGKLELMSDDGAAMGNDHRLGVIDFLGAEDASNNRVVGASIEAFCDAAWSATENGARIVFSTTDGNASSSAALTLNSDNKATFTGTVVNTSNTRIKLLPRDFSADDGGRPVMIDDTGSASDEFFLESAGSNKTYATVDIPTGYKATHVMVYGSSASDTVYVWEMQIDSKTGVSKGNGNIDTEVNITDVTSSSTNYLLLKVDNASGNEIHGGYITIAVA